MLPKGGFNTEVFMIRIGILGYGNIGRGVEYAIMQNKDMALEAVFTRRAPASVQTLGAKVYHVDEIENFAGKLDVLMLCGGTATDLPEQAPKYAAMFNTIDSFDTHAKIPEYYKAVDAAAKAGGKVSVISVGWDPGLFSLQRLYAEAVLPEGENYTFWGKGVSQGHSDAVRRVEGVLDARQYTIPKEEAVAAARSGKNPQLTTRDKHLRECFVVAEEGADLAKIEKTIKEMPNYFADYDTIVHFISAEEMKKEHSEMPHGGFVIRSGKTAGDKQQVIEYSLKLESNPQFTANVLAAYARAAYRLAEKGESGAMSVFDIPPMMLSPKTKEELLATML